MSNQPEALRLADVLDAHQFDEPHAAASCLRRLHADIEAAQQAQRDAENELSRALARHAEIEALKAERDALRAELSEATEAVDDPAVNNLRTLPESIRMLRAERDALRSLLDRIVVAVDAGGVGFASNSEDFWNAIDAAREKK